MDTWANISEKKLYAGQHVLRSMSNSDPKGNANQNHPELPRHTC